MLSFVVLPVLPSESVLPALPSESCCLLKALSSRQDTPQTSGFTCWVWRRTLACFAISHAAVRSTNG
ncbi:hypothetical protein PI124_g7771 [Phytophthora idaei]|nr:hypothetical protein PI125_g7508 [Phytophthora idaei]KAG3160308.1 hypothetical protein PI126_g6964 [Phytophthora idaei]KAG3247533.1 hypothetical protein PI124_g7771 [Phytophthora idaei]